jgi:hypothetical protein
LAFAADAGPFTALGNEDVEVAGVGVALAQVVLQPPGQHGVARWLEAPMVKVRSGPNWASMVGEGLPAHLWARRDDHRCTRGGMTVRDIGHHLRTLGTELSQLAHRAGQRDDPH